MSKMTLDTPDNGMAYSIADDLIQKGFAFPEIKRIMFNTGTKTVKPAVKDADGKEIEPAVTRPALATIIEFIDGSKTTVVNSETDQLHWDENGRPSEQDKENGIAHALAKTLLATKIDGCVGDCTRKSAGYGRIMRELVKNAYDQQEEAAKRAEAKAKSKAEHLAREAAAKKNKADRGPNLRDCVRDLQETIALLRADLEALKGVRANG